MRIDSCRKCGQTLSVKEYCSDCTQPTKLQCESCNKFTDDPIHSYCNKERLKISMAQ